MCLPSAWFGCQHSAECWVHSLLLLAFQEARWAKSTSISNRWDQGRAAPGIWCTTYGRRVHVESSAPGAPVFLFHRQQENTIIWIKCPQIPALCAAHSGIQAGPRNTETEVPFLTWQQWKSTFLPTRWAGAFLKASFLFFFVLSRSFCLFLLFRLANEIRENKMQRKCVNKITRAKQCLSAH